MDVFQDNLTEYAICHIEGASDSHAARQFLDISSRF